MRSLASGFVSAVLLLVSAAGLEAQASHNTLTFDNQSGEPALVKLVGPTAQVVEVPNGERRTVNVAAGEYYLLARYGADPKRYTYSRGDPFKVEETATQYSVISITLHKVVGGNYPTHRTSAEEFDRVPLGTAPQEQPAGEGTVPPALPAAPGFYRAEAGKWLRQPDCRGDECKVCVPKDWAEAARITPADRRAPAFLLRSLVTPLQAGQGVPSIMVFQVDSPRLTPIESALNAVGSGGETFLLSFKEGLAPGTYVVLRRLPGAARYVKFTSAQGSACFVALDGESKIMESQAPPLGVFVAR